MSMLQMPARLALGGLRSFAARGMASQTGNIGGCAGEASGWPRRERGASLSLSLSTLTSHPLLLPPAPPRRCCCQLLLCPGARHVCAPAVCGRVCSVHARASSSTRACMRMLGACAHRTRKHAPQPFMPASGSSSLLAPCGPGAAHACLLSARPAFGLSPTRPHSRARRSLPAPSSSRPSTRPPCGCVEGWRKGCVGVVVRVAGRAIGCMAPSLAQRMRCVRACHRVS